MLALRALVRTGGTGLGLPLRRALIHAQRGQIRAQSVEEGDNDYVLVANRGLQRLLTLASTSKSGEFGVHNYSQLPKL